MSQKHHNLLYQIVGRHITSKGIKMLTADILEMSYSSLELISSLSIK